MMGILNPAGAFALAAVGALIALYLHGRRRKVVPVASLFLWRQLPGHAFERQRFRSDLLFWLQLALLLALIGGYLRPYLETAARPGATRRRVLVLDVSASMQAREDGGSRFELARRRARALVAALEPGDEVMLVTAAARSRIALRWTADHARVQDRLEALEPLDTSTDLAPALELALGEARARPGTRVAVFTDLPPTASGATPAELAAVDYVQIGHTDDNVGIIGLAVEQLPFHPASDARVTVLVRNYARTPRSIGLEVTLAGVAWTRRELSIAPRGVGHVLLTDPPGAGELAIRLVARDALEVDDRAVGFVGRGEPLDIVLVTDSRELATTFEAIRSAVGGSRVERMDVASYAVAPPPDGRLVVFHGVAPPREPAGPALYVAPPPGNTVCPVERGVESAAVIDWEDDHPAVRGIGGLGALTMANPSQLATPGWGAAVVLAASTRAAFPLLVAGERDGRRLACLGADLGVPLLKSDYLPLLVLTLGTIRWLAEPAGTPPLAIQTGVPTLAEPGVSVPVDLPGLRLAGDPPVLLVDRIGIYRAGKRLILANLFDDRESDIGRSGDGEWPAANTGAGEVRRGDMHEIGWWLYLVAAVLLAIEWGAWRWRRAEEPS